MAVASSISAERERLMTVDAVGGRPATSANHARPLRVSDGLGSLFVLIRPYPEDAMAQQLTEVGETSAQLAERNAEIQDYLNRYSRALVAGDGRTIAGMWGIPALVLGDEMVIAVHAPAEVEAFFGGARDQYSKSGVTDTHPDITSVGWVTDRMAIVTVRWPYLDATGNEVGAESSTYTLKRDDQGALKLFVAVMHGVEKR
jgi:hypothetical protein